MVVVNGGDCDSDWKRVKTRGENKSHPQSGGKKQGSNEKGKEGICNDAGGCIIHGGHLSM